MKISPLPLAFTLCAWLSPVVGFTQENPADSVSFAYEFSGCVNITGVPGSDYTSSIGCHLETSENPSAIGAESWSFCVQASNATIHSITIEGTEAEGLMDSGWEINEVVDDGGGAISAAILSFRNTGTLPPEGTVSLAVIGLEGTVPAGDDQVVSLIYVDGLRGSGRPVDSIVTYDGETILPRLGTCNFTVAPDRIPPTAPLGLEAEAGDGVVHLSWTASEEADLDSYNLYRNTILIANSLAGTTFTDQDVENGLTYSYSLTALDTSGNESRPSRVVNSTPRDTTPPAAPNGLTAMAGNSLIVLDWNDNRENDLASYNLYRDGKILTSGLVESTFTDDDLVNGITYTYAVTAVDENNNESALSPAIQATPEQPPVGPFLRGDANVDLRVDIADAIWMLGYLFAGGVMPQCNAAADSNADGQVNVADPIYSLNWLFIGGSPSPPPSSCDVSSRPQDIRQGCDQPAC